MLAHRAAWELHHAEPVPAGMVVMHACDIRACVNPSHLRPGTPLENNLDKVQKGRQISGAKHHKTKLTPDQVRFIRRALDAKLATKKQLARQFGVADTSIHRIAIRKNWRHLN